MMQHDQVLLDYLADDKPLLAGSELEQELAQWTLLSTWQEICLHIGLEYPSPIKTTLDRLLSGYWQVIPCDMSKWFKMYQLAGKAQSANLVPPETDISVWIRCKQN